MIYNFLVKNYVRFRKNFKRIVCLHSIHDKTLTKKRFEEYLDSLDRYNIQIISLKKILNIKEKGRFITLTFDDGYKDNVVELLPVLIERGISATVFVATGQLNRMANDPLLIKNRMYNLETMSYEDIKTWLAAGMEIGYHTKHHINLYNSDVSNIETDFSEGIKVFNQLINGGNRYFAYPFGDLPKEKGKFEKILNENNFDFAFTTEWSDIDKNKNPYYISRITLGNRDSINKMVAKSIGLMDVYYRLRYRNVRNII